jgi:adenylate cyclase
VAAARRLAAIMFTDMVGFTQGAQLDERATLTRLTELEGLVRPLILAQQGRVVKSTGDGLLVEFPSALKATECAVSIQEKLRDRNLHVGGAPIELRIGIHLGDVEERGEDIFGDAVNLAARVQPTAEAGGVSISQQVFDQVRNKLSLRFEPLPPQALKGVRVPITIFRVVLPWQPAGGATADEIPGAGRLAVLPFANISPDPRDAYFSDGLTEEVIAVLSELKDLRVIARTSVDHYKLAPKPVSQVGLELGVQWVLEGSVRKDGSRLRFTAQLIDARTQEHLWSGRYDRELVDIFALQSELARQVADALKIKLLAGETERLDRRRVPKPESYLEYLQGRISLRILTQESLAQAKEHFERAISLDDQNASAYAGLAETLGILSSVYRTMTRQDASRETRRLAQRARELDPGLAEVHTIVALELTDDYDYATAMDELRQAIALNPSYAGAHFYYATTLADVNRPEEALKEYDLAEQLDPLSTLVLGEHISLLAYLSRLDEARAKLERLGDIDKHGILYQDRLGLIALMSGDLEGYRVQLDWFAEHYPGRPEITAARALLEALAGHPERAREILATLESMPESIRPTGMIPPVYVVLGDLDACFLWLDRTVAEGRFAPRSWLYDPRREPVRRDPRFAALLRRTHAE